MVQQGSEYSLEVCQPLPNWNIRLHLRDSPKSNFSPELQISENEEISENLNIFRPWLHILRNNEKGENSSPWDDLCIVKTKIKLLFYNGSPSRKFLRLAGFSMKFSILYVKPSRPERVERLNFFFLFFQFWSKYIEKLVQIAGKLSLFEISKIQRVGDLLYEKSS